MKLSVQLLAMIIISILKLCWNFNGKTSVQEKSEHTMFWRQRRGVGRPDGLPGYGSC